MYRNRRQKTHEAPKGGILLSCPNCGSTDLKKNKKGIFNCLRCQGRHTLEQLKWND